MAAEQATSLSQGSKGEVVKELQQWLNHFGFVDKKGEALKDDGSYGNKTTQAVKNFQTQVGLEVDGTAGVNTIESIISYKGDQNEEEENGQAVQGSQEEVNAPAQEEPEEEGQEEVTPSEPQQPEEQPQAETPPPEEEYAQPEEELYTQNAETPAPTQDPALNQQSQPQQQTAQPVQQAPDENNPSQMDPLLDPRRSKEDQQTANRWQSYANRPAPASPEPTPRPVPAPEPAPEPAQQQQTAGNYQKSIPRTQASTEPATNTIVPTTTPAEPEAPAPTEPEAPAPAENSPAEQPASTELAAYSTRDELKGDLMAAYLKFQEMVKASHHNGIDELLQQVQTIQQRAAGLEQTYPKLMSYLNLLQTNTTKWANVASESVDIRYRPILSEGILDAVSDKFDAVSDWFSGDSTGDSNEEHLAKAVEWMNSKPDLYMPSLSSVEKARKSATQKKGNFDPNDERVTWEYDDVKHWHPILKFITQATFMQYQKTDREKLSTRKRNAAGAVKRYDQAMDFYAGLGEKVEPDIDEDALLAEMPNIIKKGESLPYNTLQSLITILIRYKDTPSGGSLDYDDAIDYFNKNLAKEAESRTKAKTIDDEASEYDARVNALALAKNNLETKLRLGMDPNSPAAQDMQAAIDKQEAELARLQGSKDTHTALLNNREQALKIAAEKKAKAEKTAAEDTQAMHLEQLQDLEKVSFMAASRPGGDTEVAATEDIDIEEQKTSIMDDIKAIGDEAITLLTTTIDNINFNEEDAPSEGPKREQFLNIGELIAKLTDGIGTYKETYNHEELLVLQSDFKELNEQVNNYLT